MAYCRFIFYLNYIFAFVEALPKPIKLSSEVCMKITVDDWREHSIKKRNELDKERHITLRRRAVILLRENGRCYFQ